MWKHDEAVRPPTARESDAAPAAVPTAGRPEAAAKGQNERDMVNIGKSVVIKGELNGSEDLILEGQVEGRIELREHVLTIGSNGRIKSEIVAKAVVVFGEVIGNISASEKVDIRENGSVEGDIVAPRVVIAEGAHFRGSVDMQRAGKPTAARQPGQAEGRPEQRPEQRPVSAGPPSPPQGQRVGV